MKVMKLNLIYPPLQRKERTGKRLMINCPEKLRRRYIGLKCSLKYLIEQKNLRPKAALQNLQPQNKELQNKERVM